MQSKCTRKSTNNLWVNFKVDENSEFENEEKKHGVSLWTKKTKSWVAVLHSVAHHVAHVDVEIQLGQIHSKQHQSLPGNRLGGQVTAAMVTLVFARFWMADTGPLFPSTLCSWPGGSSVRVAESLRGETIGWGLGHGTYMYKSIKFF